MGYYEKLLQIDKIRDALQDEESVTIFNARINYMIDRDVDSFCKVIESMDKKWMCKELEDMLHKEKYEGIIIFGSGHDGRWTKRVLELCHYVPHYFCESDLGKVGSKVEGIPIISISYLLENCQNYLVILGSMKYSEEMYHILLDKRFPQNKILFPKYKLLIAECGLQYFDIYEAGENETFVDGGSFNGDTIIDFLSWTESGGGVKKYNKIFAFEPADDMAEYIKDRIEVENIEEIKVYKKALWNKEEKLSFLEANSASQITESGTLVIEGIELNRIVGDEKVTFLKLDVEGSELKALEGARNVIKRDKPRIAVCIYHKPEDIIVIPEYLLELVPEYKFYIRHYCSTPAETVLYANI